MLIRKESRRSGAAFADNVGKFFVTEDYPRLNIFQRYQLSVYFNETGKGGYPLEEYRDQISEEQYELESLLKDEKRAVRRMLDLVGSGEL
jgi:hypothetical protein